MKIEMANIRMAEAADAREIADLSRRTFYDTFSPYNSKENMDKFMKEQFNEEKLLAECRDPANSFLLAYLNDKLVGYVKLRPSDESSDHPGPDSIEIVRIYAAQEVIGQGIGKMLMEAAHPIRRRKKITQPSGLAFGIKMNGPLLFIKNGALRNTAVMFLCSVMMLKQISCYTKNYDSHIDQRHSLPE